jgi:hypothetical protein
MFGEIDPKKTTVLITIGSIVIIAACIYRFNVITNTGRAGEKRQLEDMTK